MTDPRPGRHAAGPPDPDTDPPPPPPSAAPRPAADLAPDAASAPATGSGPAAEPGLDAEAGSGVVGGGEAGEGRDGAGAEEPVRRDQWRPVRRTVGQVTIAFTVLFLVPLIRLVLGMDENGPAIHRSPLAWVVWLAGLAVMVAAALIAVQALRAQDRATEVRFTWWCGGLWLGGFVLTTIYSSLVN